MKRVTAHTLVLVNWRGVFYQRYLMDPRVTALEGSNGAGKTTVMIAAYVVLLPDMNLLRFTNVGEHGATGGDRGLHGRLGEAGSPTYAVLDLRIGDERLIAGVLLERRAEPSVELSPFVITGLGVDVALQDVLLDRQEQDRVPEVQRLRELAAQAGGKLKMFASAREYFAELFERGVTPLRLAADEERRKYNEMLRTSMMGGISRTLADGLRGFLLKEETGLADTLKRMRQNLDACRRTRSEVGEARQIEAEISDVYEAGLKLFAAAVHASRERAEESLVRLKEARRVASDMQLEHVRITGDHEAAIELRDEARSELEGTTRRAQDGERGLERLRTANKLHLRIGEDEVVERARVAAHAEAMAMRDGAEQAARDAGQGREAARTAHTRAAEGLADFKQGFEELERRAAEHRVVVTRLADARAGLPGEDVKPATLVDVTRRCDERLRGLDVELAQLARQLAVAGEQREAFTRVLAALERLIQPERIADGDAHGRAEQCLADLREREALAQQKPTLKQALADARARQSKQCVVRQSARSVLGADAALGSESLREAHESADTSAHDLAERLRTAQSSAVDATRRSEVAATLIAELESLSRRWSELRRRADELRVRHERPTFTRGELEALRVHLQAERDAVHRKHEEQLERRDRVTAEARHLEQSGGQFAPDLLKARDLVGAELLAGRFDDVSLAEAGELQARLGPLHAALIVDDVHAAATRLAAAKDRPETLWLVGQEAALDLDNDPPERLGRDLLVAAAEGWRLTRIPEQPTLGKRARQRQIESLRREEATLTAECQQLAAQEAALAGSLRDIAGLMPDVAILERTDPQPELARARRDAAVATDALTRLAAEIAALKPMLAAAEARRGALVRLLPDANLLDPPDFTEEASRLAVCLAEADAAELELRRCAADRTQLARGLETLRSVPLTEAELADMRHRQAAAIEARDTLQHVVSALRFVHDHIAALEWTDAEAALAAKVRLKPALERQLEIARDQLERAETTAKRAEAELQSATLRCNATDAQLQTIVAALADQRARLAELGIDDASDTALAAAEAEVAALSRRVAELTVDERDLADKAATWAERLRNAKSKLEAAERDVEDKTRAWEPERDGWESLRREAEDKGLLAATSTPTIVQEMLDQGSVNLWSKVSNYTTLLSERLRKIRDGTELAEQVRQTMAGPARTSTAALGAWIAVRDWLRRRVPAQIAEVDDPLAALARLREHLERLERRLEEQEQALRGETGDVARNIETAIRKAHQQISRLNGELARVSFGSICGVRIRVDRVDRMEQVLHALKEGAAQELLWQRSLTIEDALDELFRQVGGGKISGHRLLDYREYLGLAVEVQRRASPTWEVANPTRMSTGEAIGVGAALMMVVLTSWERDANLLRAKRSLGTLRILFLDEANRLSQDNLAILFDLCESLELQLLLAAPEVARAEGNTTYRLVRQVDRGREEVLVTGRRIAPTSA
ncbi:chromosome partition protein MukB [Nannocystis sp.]|uniref:chromosome partition protein MukB n=1 Tax=Nannocystis sp. TaxID=1962667 RepID=UPI002600D2DF|nr:chromosome partition protein MukB [Nannocystis sp.]MBK7827214.1 chromosome partition protein MukB [Nannocystis sp.]